ncbi:MAG: ATP-binding protein [Chloroflexi bacterium]|nr:ATP-binding protein [Chloroflexota bacterium]
MVTPAAAPAATGLSVLAGCQPRQDVLRADLQDALFAARFDEVMEGRAPTVYSEAATFFRNTHPGASLKAVARRVFAHLNHTHRPGTAIRLHTGFGGGKTHALIALWHLANHSGVADVGNDLVPAAERPHRVDVAGIDGQTAGRDVVSYHGGRAIRTLWGELAWQLGRDAGVKALLAQTPDDPATLPHLDVTRSILPDGPVLLLFDELVLYLAAWGEGTPQATTTLLFIRQLMALAATRPGLVVVIADPGPQLGYAGLGEQLDKAAGPTQAERAAAQAALGSEAGRLATDFDPVGGEAIAVITRRLLESVNPTVAKATAGQYRAAYERIRATDPDVLPPEVCTDVYQAQIEAAYPFHPRLLRTVQDRLQALPEFQRSRGTLRLFARLLRQVWERQADLPLISAGGIDWTDQLLQSELLDRLQRGAFRPALQADVHGHAARLDEALATGDAHRRAARALFLESLQVTPAPSMDRADVTLAALRPSDAGTEIAEGIARLAGVAWHITEPATGVYRFTVEPSVNKRLEEKMARIPEADAAAEVRSHVQAYYAGRPLHVRNWPRNAADVADRPVPTLALCDRLALAQDVVAYKDTSPRDRPAAGAAPGEPLPRQYRNTIMALAPRTDQWRQAIGYARRLLAARELDRELQAEATMPGSGQISATLARQQLKPIMDVLPRQVPVQSRLAWTALVLPEHEPLTVTEGYLAAASPTGGNGALNGQQRLLDMLKDNELRFTEDDMLGPQLLVDRVLPGTTPHDGDADLFTAKDIHERVLSMSGLRFFLDDGPVRRGIAAAARQGLVALHLTTGDAYLGDRRCSGAPGQRTVTQLPPEQGPASFQLDDLTLIARPASARAREWMAPSPQPAGGGSGPTGPTDDQPVDGPPVPWPQSWEETANDWQRARELAVRRPLHALTVVIADPAHMPKLAVVGRVLNAKQPLMSIEVLATVGGDPAADAGLTPSRVQLSIDQVPRTHAAAGDLAQIAANLARRLPGSTYQAQLSIAFTGDEEQTQAARRLRDAQVDEHLLHIEAHFGPERAGDGAAAITMETP